MKKIYTLIILFLIYFNISFANDLDRPEYSSGWLNENIIKYNWKPTGSFKAQNGILVQKLKKGEWHLYCALLIEDTICWLP